VNTQSMLKNDGQPAYPTGQKSRNQHRK